MPGSNEQAASERHQERSAEPSGLKVAGLYSPCWRAFLANVVIELFLLHGTRKKSQLKCLLYTRHGSCARASLATPPSTFGFSGVSQRTRPKLQAVRVSPAHTLVSPCRHSVDYDPPLSETHPAVMDLWEVCTRFLELTACRLVCRSLCLRPR